MSGYIPKRRVSAPRFLEGLESECFRECEVFELNKEREKEYLAAERSEKRFCSFKSTVFQIKNTKNLMSSKYSGLLDEALFGVMEGRTNHIRVIKASKNSQPFQMQSQLSKVLASTKDSCSSPDTVSRLRSGRYL